MERQELARLAEHVAHPQYLVLPARLVAGLVAHDVTELAAGLGGLAPSETLPWTARPADELIDGAHR